MYAIYPHQLRRVRFIRSETIAGRIVQARVVFRTTKGLVRSSVRFTNARFGHHPDRGRGR